jgi:hypothetical protein
VQRRSRAGPGPGGRRPRRRAGRAAVSRARPGPGPGSGPSEDRSGPGSAVGLGSRSGGCSPWAPVWDSRQRQPGSADSTRRHSPSAKRDSSSPPATREARVWAWKSSRARWRACSSFSARRARKLPASDSAISVTDSASRAVSARTPLGGGLQGRSSRMAAGRVRAVSASRSMGATRRRLKTAAAATPASATASSAPKSLATAWRTSATRGAAATSMTSRSPGRPSSAGRTSR